MIHSPVTGGPTVLVKKLESKVIISLYESQYNCDVSRFFTDLPFIEKRRRVETGYQFFYPYSIQGDPNFYGDLYYSRATEKSADWAYSEHRFEFDWVKERCQNLGGRLLDIGAGSGAFLDFVGDLFPEKVGIETSSKAVEQAKRRGLTVYERNLKEHKGKRGCGAYDVVTAFQVLEHIHSVGDFLRDCLDLLAPGGILVLAVPNNSGFVGKHDHLALNLPPHHMGLWEANSLYDLSLSFNMPLVALEEEPLQERNTAWYISWAERRYLPQSRIARSLYYRLGGRRFFEAFVEDNRQSISGHTILAAYRKPSRVALTKETEVERSCN